MIEQNHLQLSLSRQRELAGMARSSYYYQPRGESAFNLELMRLIDYYNLERPHSSLNDRTLNEVYAGIKQRSLAA